MSRSEEHYQDSIYYFKRGEFKNYIQAIDDKSISFSDAVATFREARCLPKKFKQITLQQAADNPELIRELYDALRKMAPESKYKLPYKKEEREEELIDNLADVYDIDKKHTQAKIVIGHHKNEDTGQEFNYALEIVVAPRKDIGVNHAGEVEIIGNINTTPSIDGGERFFDGGRYVWTHKDEIITQTSLRGILHECGFNSSSYVSTSKKKVPSVVYVNLRTPCPDWLGSAGKTHVDLKPFQGDIAKTLSSLAYKIPSYHGKGYNATIKYPYEREEFAQDYVDDFLKERKREIVADPSLKIRDRITQRGACYRIRRKAIQAGFEPKSDWGTTMKTMAASISQRCEVLFGCTREELGIVASARAIMYYKGQSYPVDIDSIEELAEKGVATIVIEKEGIADVLANHADKYGVALVHTKGRLTEYGKDLIEAIKNSGSGIVGILVDYDAYGQQIAEGTITETPKLGIDMETITWLQQNGYSNLSIEDVEERYTPKIWTDDPYLKNHRIELDSVAAIVGGEGLWKYIMYKLHNEAPEGFDLADVITMPANEILYPKTVSDFLSYLNEYTDKILENESKEIDEELQQVIELIEIKAKEDEIQQRLEEIVVTDPGMNTIVKKLDDLLKILPETLTAPTTKESDNNI
jgi:hypothetical protein